MGSDFLFALPTMLSGVARCLDLGAQLDQYNESPAVQIADAKALFNDWRITGQDLIEAMQFSHPALGRVSQGGK